MLTIQLNMAQNYQESGWTPKNSGFPSPSGDNSKGVTAQSLRHQLARGEGSARLQTVRKIASQ